MATPPGFNGSYMNTWEYIFFPERFEVEENIRRGITPVNQNQRANEVARVIIPMPNNIGNSSTTNRDA